MGHSHGDNHHSKQAQSQWGDKWTNINVYGGALASVIANTLWFANMLNLNPSLRKTDMGNMDGAIEARTSVSPLPLLIAFIMACMLTIGSAYAHHNLHKSNEGEKDIEKGNEHHHGDHAGSHHSAINGAAKPEGQDETTKLLPNKKSIWEQLTPVQRLLLVLDWGSHTAEVAAPLALGVELVFLHGAGSTAKVSVNVAAAIAGGFISGAPVRTCATSVVDNTKHHCCGQ